MFNSNMALFLAIILFALAQFQGPVEGANILFYFACSGLSHRFSAWPIIEKLANSGHHVTFVSPYPAKNPKPHPNITDFIPENFGKDLGVLKLDFIGTRLQGGVSAIDELWDTYMETGKFSCNLLMQKPDFVKFVESSKFDLIILNSFYNECGYGLVHKYKAKVIMYSPTSHLMWFKEAYGYADENIPEMNYHFPLAMTFFQSVKNELVSLILQYRRQTQIFPVIEEALKKGLKIPDLPPLGEIEKNTSIIFTATHFTEEYPRSLPRNVVEIGGIHCNDDRKPLPKELEDFINSSEDGFILISFGTYAAISTLPLYLQNIFFEAISKVPSIKFIIRFNGDIPKNFPKNAIPSTWIPQQDLLAHPKIRAFIGHGGLLGTQEAIYHAVPMIVIPFFVEQDYQASRAHERQTAISLEISELTEEKLLNAILELLNNKKYKENTMKISKLFRDRPHKPLEEAVYWIEYVLRHDDLSHLRSVGINKTWYERRMLHIWAFISILLITILSFVMFCAYILIRMIFKLFAHKKPKLE